MTLLSRAAQDVIASVFASQLEYGIDDYPNGTSAAYAPGANVALKMAQDAAKTGTLTFADLMLGQLYRVLATENPAELRYQLTGLTAQALAWMETLDRRSGVHQ